MARQHLQHHYSALRPSGSFARGRCSGFSSRYFTTTCSADCEDWSEKFSNTTPTPLCDSLVCVHPYNEGLHRGLLPRRGPSVRSAPLACPRPSCVSLSSGFFHCHCHCHTLLPFTCAPDFLSCIARGSDPRF